MTLKPTLLILAAGMGTRYGGLKQIDPIGPNEELIIDYSMYDAIRAGFEKIVFVIRHYFEKAFREKIGSKLDGIVETFYAYQELDSRLGGFALPEGREKPWGTGHAILVAEDVIDEPFAVINADDYYGPDSLRVIRRYLSNPSAVSDRQYAMVGFKLRNTLSEHGYVSRGVCAVDSQMNLESVVERTKIKRTENGASFRDSDGVEYSFGGNEIVSMNLWGFHPSIFGCLHRQFQSFLRQNELNNQSEFFIPSAVDELLRQRHAAVKVLTTPDRWFGVTYQEDKNLAQACIRKLIDRGTYPERLWAH
jgi:UTP-glucose-1-phosphate uridylyltransferase